MSDLGHKHIGIKYFSCIYHFDEHLFYVLSKKPYESIQVLFWYVVTITIEHYQIDVSFMNNIPTNKVIVLVLSGVNIGIDYHKCDGSPPGETMTYVSLGLWSMACDRSLHRQSFWVTCEVEWFLGIRDLCLKRKWKDFLGFMYHLKKSARSAYKQTRTSGLKLVKGLLFWFEKFIEPFSCISSVCVLPPGLPYKPNKWPPPSQSKYSQSDLNTKN